MSKYYFYRMTYDTGFAPNPFGKYLTLAACTPNHCRCNVDVGDYIVGVEALGLAKKRIGVKYKTDVKQSLIYIAKISEVLTLDEYFKDIRFKYKKYTGKESWIERRGDNVYFKDNNHWKWIEGHDHDPENSEAIFFEIEKINKIYDKKNNGYGPILQDIRGDRVFISDDFMYLGDKCISFEQRFINLIPHGQGTKCNHNEKELDIFKDYIKNLKNKYKIGKHGNPINCHIDDYCKKDKQTIEKSCGSK